MAKGVRVCCHCGEKYEWWGPAKQNIKYGPGEATIELIGVPMADVERISNENYNVTAVCGNCKEKETFIAIAE